MSSSVFFFSTERMTYSEERVSSLHRGKSAPLLYVEEADSFSVQKREERLLLVAKKSVSLFVIERITYSFSLHRRVCSSALQRG